MPPETILEILVLVVGFYMAWNIGANDVSNAMGTSVGSGALTLAKAVCVAAVLEFSGAFFLGANVSETIQNGLIDIDRFLPDPMVLMLGMLAALLGTSIWLQIASAFRWPVSTTHSIVGAILGFGGVVGGIDAIRWAEVLSIAISWVVAPLTAAILSYTLFIILQKNILFALRPIAATVRILPFLVFATFFTFTLSLLFNGLENLPLHPSFPQALGIALLIASTAGLICYFFVHRMRSLHGAITTPPSRHPQQTVVSLEKAIKHLQRVHASSFNEAHETVGKILSDAKNLSQNLRKETQEAPKTSQYHTVERMFISMQIITACFVALGHGANDVSNAIGPVGTVLHILKHKSLTEAALIPPWLLAFGGLGIIIGLATWGWRVIETIGKKITELTPTRGFCAEFGVALTILVASKMGLPVSTTHSLVGAVLGVGLAGGLRALNLGMIREILLSWIITMPASALMSIGIFYALRWIFL